jgi:dTDP-4-amino-4,6-dideoxygalactose transaminase
MGCAGRWRSIASTWTITFDMNAMHRIPQCDPHASYLAQQPAIDAAIRRVLDKGRYILGDEVAAFENEFAAFLGASHAVGVANGTDALELALRALGIGAGDAVVTVSHTAVATAVAVRRTGAIPLFADVDAEHGLMDPASVSELLARAAAGKLAVPVDRIRAIVPVHLYGRCADMDTICQLAQAHDLHLVEDCAQAHGARFNGRCAGTFGTFGAFSFYPTKNLGALGDGGAVVTSDAGLDRQVRLLREYGWRQRYVSDIEGGNSRLDELQAAILRVKLEQLDADNQARRRIARDYQAQVANPELRMPGEAPSERHAYHQFVVSSPRRDELQLQLRGQGVDTLVHYPVPVHLQPAYAHPGYAPLPLPHTEQWAREVLSLPMFPQLRADSVSRVASAVNAWRPSPA